MNIPDFGVINDYKYSYLKNIIDIIIKGKELTIGAVINNSLYLCVNGGLLYTVALEGFENDVLYFKSSSIDNEAGCIYNNPIFQSEMSSILNSVYERKGELIYDNPELRMDENFESIINSNTKDGAYRYWIDTSRRRTFIYLYKNMFGLTKADSISLKVFDCPIIDKVMVAEFDIFKKKIKNTIKLQLLFLNF